MIFSLREGLREKLIERGYPVAVDCGYARPMLRGSVRQRHRVVVARDREGGDSLGPHPGGSADSLFARMVGYTISVYAFAPTAGALQWEHDNEADLIVDGVIVALHDWSAEQKAWRWEYVSGRMLLPDEIQGDVAEELPVSGYKLQVRVGRAVTRRDYDGGLIYGTAEITEVVTDAEASIDGDSYEEIE